MSDDKVYRESEIEGFGKIICTKLEPVDAYLLLGKIGKIVIPALIAAKGVQKNDAATDMMPAVRALFDQLTPELQKQVMIDLLGPCSVVKPDDGGEMQRLELLGGVKVINNAFRGYSVKVLFKAMAFALEVNFGDFFDGSVDIGAAIRKLSK